jgi:tetratricopeptide (TPR) repeat protein
LSQARALLDSVLQSAGDDYRSFVDLARAGLADYHFKSDRCDSTLSYTHLLLADAGLDANPNTAHAAHLAGQCLAKQGELEQGVELLKRSAEEWRSLGGSSDLIDTYNDLGAAYLELSEHYQARVYLLAATQLAIKFDLPHKKTYDIDMNALFLDKLSSENYLAAGEEVEELVREISNEMGLD